MAPIHRLLITLMVVACVCAASATIAGIASEAAVAAPKSDAAKRTVPVAAPAVAPKVQADLRQLMRGILFPCSNVVFAAQEDLDRFPKVEDPSVSPNPLTSTYGGWDAVQRADWQKYVRGLRDAANVAYKAALTKSTDAMLDASDTLTQACTSCHEVYREKESKGGDKNRCLP
jgi:hypothetical protein